MELHKSADAKTLGAAIRAARLQMGASIAVAAQELGVSTQFLFDLESGKPTVQWDRALKVAELAGLKIIIAAAEPSNSVLARRVARRKQHDAEAHLAALHEEIVSRLKAASPVLARKITRLGQQEVARWERDKLCHPRYISAWRDALGAGPLGIERDILGNATEQRALLQNTPFSFWFAKRTPGRKLRLKPMEQVVK